MIILLISKQQLKLLNVLCENVTINSFAVQVKVYACMCPLILYIVSHSKYITDRFGVGIVANRSDGHILEFLHGV